MGSPGLGAGWGGARRMGSNGEVSRRCGWFQCRIVVGWAIMERCGWSVDLGWLDSWSALKKKTKRKWGL
ncbi:hypothetical protein TIFTF001_034251 [Ficus carica]|uniref:Uncharacterized protein n=1 Tax=Ficus carica TaxID=3494 RepID=A0AA88E0T4_FICCA|nr:hypothetical protein TIFTF001_034251 [Ficus carica]